MDDVKAGTIERTWTGRVRRFVEDMWSAKTSDREARFAAPTLKVEGVPTDTFNEIVDEFRAAGWRKVKEYNNVDAWIDYGLVVLGRRGELLKCEWTNWEEGSFEGAPPTIESLKARLARV